MFPSFALRAGGFIFNELPPYPQISQAIEHVGLRSSAIPPGPANLLVVGLHGAGQIRMHHKAHVGLVDAHAKGDGGHHNHRLIRDEGVLIGLAGRLIHGCVVRKGMETFLLQQRGHRLCFFAGEAVHNAALPAVAGQDVQKLLLPVPLHLHREVDVGSVKPLHHLLHPPLQQLLGNVVPCDGIRGGCQGQDGHLGEDVVEAAEIGIFRTKAVTPLGNTVGLVNGQQREGQFGEGCQHGFRHETFRCHVEQSGPAGNHATPCGDVLFPLLAGVDAFRCHATEAQGCHLVLHQGH